MSTIASIDVARSTFSQYFPSRSRAVCITRERGGKTQYRIAPYEPRTDIDVPLGGYLSNWCDTEVRAWNAAIRRMSDRANSREHW